jgi:hypothetical protein
MKRVEKHHQQEKNNAVSKMDLNVGLWKREKENHCITCL